MLMECTPAWYTSRTVESRWGSTIELDLPPTPLYTPVESGFDARNLRGPPAVRRGRRRPPPSTLPECLVITPSLDLTGMPGTSPLLGPYRDAWDFSQILPVEHLE